MRANRGSSRHLRLWPLAVFLTVLACTSHSEISASTAIRAGLFAQKAGDLDTATAFYRSALEEQSTNLAALFDLGTVAQAKGDTSEAERLFRHALDIDPRFVPALFNLAIVRTSVGATQEAIDLYRRVIAVAPNDGGAHLNFGLLLRAAGRQREGDEQVAIGRALGPG